MTHEDALIIIGQITKKEIVILSLVSEKGAGVSYQVRVKNRGDNDYLAWADNIGWEDLVNSVRSKEGRKIGVRS